jgi:hypothetical protein
MSPGVVVAEAFPGTACPAVGLQEKQNLTVPVVVLVELNNVFGIPTGSRTNSTLCVISTILPG